MEPDESDPLPRTDQPISRSSIDRQSIISLHQMTVRGASVPGLLILSSFFPHFVSLWFVNKLFGWVRSVGLPAGSDPDDGPEPHVRPALR